MSNYGPMRKLIAQLCPNRGTSIAVFGGQGNLFRIINSVESYNSQTGKWERSDIRLNRKKKEFGFLTLKLSDIISELQCINK